MVFSEFKVVKQLDSMDCGPACLSMICMHYGVNIPLSKLRELCGKGKYGTSLYSINHAAQDIGMQTHPVKISFDTLLHKMHLPCIVHWDNNHYVVVYKLSKNAVWIADPLLSKIKMSYSEFRKHWEIHGDVGIALQMLPTLEMEKHDERESFDANGIKRILYHAKQYKPLFTQLFIGTVLVSILNICMPFLMQALIDRGVRYKDIDFVYTVLAAQLLFFLGKTVTEFIRGWLVTHIGVRINVNLISEFLHKLSRLSISFFDTRNLADILQRILDYEKIENVITQHAVATAFSIINLIAFSFVIITFNFTLFAIFATGSLLSLVWLLMFLSRRRALDYRYFYHARESQSTVMQIVNGIVELKVNSADEKYRRNWQVTQANLFGVKLDALRLQQFQQSGVLLLNEGKNILITVIAALQVINGDLTIGGMLAISYIMGQMSAPIEQLMRLVTELQDAKIGLDRLDEVQNTKAENEAHSIIYRNTKLSGNLVLENVSYKYGFRDKEFVLENISCEIPADKVTAIVGASGSGKTTILKLLMNFYQVTSGHIMVGNKHLNSIDPETWRSHCGAVLQDGYIFNDTLANNICLSTEFIDIDRLHFAGMQANLHEEITKLPLGYHTKIGKDGIDMSGGQKQRILLARAIYKNPDYIFLDEATSALDANNERIVKDNIKEVFKGKTVVIIAHRLSTVKHADQIIVLNKGRIVESGTHSELIAQNNAYYQLVKNQLESG